MVFRKKKIPSSIVGEELTTQKVNAIITLWKEYHKANQMMIKIDNDLKNDKIGEWEHDEKMKLLIEARNSYMELINTQLIEWQRYKEINERYNRTESDDKLPEH